MPRKINQIVFFLFFLLLLSISAGIRVKEVYSQNRCDSSFYPACRDGDRYCRGVCANGRRRECHQDEINRTCRCICPRAGTTPTPTPTSPPAPPPPPQPEPTGPFPSPYVPCDATRPQEFHSLRPYQASPCNQNVSDIALFCGNDLLVYDRLEVIAQHNFNGRVYTTFTFEGQPIDPVCQVNPNPSPDGLYRQTCRFSINRQKRIAIDLSKAYLPIMGYTEPSRGSQSNPQRVINSLYQNETVDNPTKVNEYISWYLNGLIGRAEYDPPNPNTEEGRRKIIDFSGPLKKLLSLDSQISQRLSEQGRAGRDRHNQIVACRQGTNPRFCYPSQRTRVRLSQPSPTGTLSRLFSYIPFSSTEDRKGEVEAQTSPFQIAGQVILTNVRLLNQRPAELFFAHMQEGFELSDLLQKLIVPKDLPR